MMKKYYVIKVNRIINKPELLEVLQAKNLKEAKVAAGQKYTDFITDVEIGLAIVGEQGYKEYWKDSIESLRR